MAFTLEVQGLAALKRALPLVLRRVRRDRGRRGARR